MRRSLAFKLVVAFIAISVIAVALVALASYAVTAFEFNRLVTQEASNSYVGFVADYYSAHGSLDGIDQALHHQRPSPGDSSPGGPPPIFSTPLTDPEGVVYVGGQGLNVGQKVAPQALSSGTPVSVDGHVIAVVLPRQAPPPRNRQQEQFFQNTVITLGLAALGAAIVATLLGIVIARTITRPVTELTLAAGQMAKGKLGQTVQVRSQDEVGQLATAFNRMSAELKQLDQTRRQMTADIAHELRNPLTVIGGYIDAMRAGDLHPTPARLDAVHGEVEHLEHLVDDLRTLALADAGALALNRQPLAPAELLARAARAYEPQAQQKNIALEVQRDGELPYVDADEARINQVLGNLMSNALRHTGDGGRLRLSAARDGTRVRFAVSDTGEGIPPGDLERVFLRFYRADSARQGTNGESGLGLAIAKALVEAHGGKIWAESAPGAGATFIFELPAAT